MSIDPKVLEAARRIVYASEGGGSYGTVAFACDAEEVARALLAGEGPVWTGACRHCPANFRTRWELEEHERECSASPSPAVRDAPGWAEAIEAAMKKMDQIGCDWRDAGDMIKFYATNYLVEAVRSLHPSAAEPDAPKEEQT